VFGEGRAAVTVMIVAGLLDPQLLLDCYRIADLA
jgi:hypothetical protein